MITILISVVIILYLGMILFALVFANGMIFQPPPSSYQDSPKIIKLNSGDEAKISAIFLPNQDAKYTILYSHGNAIDLGRLHPILEEIRAMGFSVFAYDYRGYGTSLGTPSEKHAYRDINAAYEHLINEKNIPADQIIAYGQSLGGAVAADLASRKPLGGLILESSFVSAYRVLTKVPLLPFDQFKTIDKIKRVQCPVLVIHGKKDRVIPFWHGKKLFAEAHEPKQACWIEEAGHNNLLQVAGNRYKRAIHAFIDLADNQ